MSLMIRFIAVIIACSALQISIASLMHAARNFHILPENQFPKPVHHVVRFIATTIPHLSTNLLH